MKKQATKKLGLHAQTVRTLSALELREAAGGDVLAPPQTNGSSAQSCQTTRFACCLPE